MDKFKLYWTWFVDTSTLPAKAFITPLSYSVLNSVRLCKNNQKTPQTNKNSYLRLIKWLLIIMLIFNLDTPALIQYIQL